MKLCIAEKPSVAKEIAHIIGAKQRNDGYFEGNGYQVTWTFGHLCTLKEPQDYHQIFKRWQLGHLPIIPPKFGIKLIGNKGVEKQFKTIERLVGSAEEVINCGDAGQEGELIQRWVLQKANCQAPVKRLWISSLTEEAIRKGFKDLKPAADFDQLYYAGSSRAIGDWLLGINATRLYTLKYGAYGNLLSIGRVQTPTLAMIVQRHLEVESFVSKPFWELKTVYREVIFSCTEGKMYEEEKAQSLQEKVVDKPLTISEFERKEGKETAPKLFDLTSLQVECNKKLSLSADETLKIAQTLYESKNITYPRVDTRYLPDDIYPTIEGVLKSMTGYQALVAPLIGKPIRKTKNIFNNTKVTDHHAIIPTNVRPSSLSGQNAAVYDIIAKRFIANFYDDCKVSKTTVIGIVDDTTFKASGKEILEPGWRTVYGAEQVDDDDKKSKDDDEPNQLMPEFVEGESGPHEPKIEQKSTTPPKAYTEATLLRAMETAGKQVDDEEMRDLMKENGIGRPSTRANIIETLFRRKYIVRQRKNIIATNTGIQLIETIQNDLLKSAELTGTWELHLRQIESGEYDVMQFMEEMKSMVKELVLEVKNERYAKKIEAPKEPEKPKPKPKAPKVTLDQLACPKCNKGKLLKGKSAFGCSKHTEGCSFLVPFEFAGKKLSATQIVALVSKNKTPTIKDLVVNGNKKPGIITFDKDFSLSVKEKEEAPLLCPRCKEGNMLKGKNAYGCSRFRENCKTLIPFNYQGKELTSSQLLTLIRKGRTGKIKGFKSGDNNEISGRVLLNKHFELELIQD